jgi:branched-chain amino acid transport system ATP-binding protein/urea transport system ATP-binding protein
VLTIRDLVAGYQGGSEVLRKLSLEIAEGEIVALMGRNGMGKSTLLKAIMGHVPIHAGTIRFCERELVGLRPFAISNLGIAYVPQGREIFRAFTVEENLLLGVLGKRHLQREVPHQLYAWFPILAERRRQRGETMSGGEQQQLAIARALAGQPRLLLLDEPSEGIQPSIVQSLGATLRRIADAERLTMLLVEQNLDLVLGLAGRCLFIENGRLVDETTPAQLRAEPSLLYRYLSV